MSAARWRRRPGPVSLDVRLALTLTAVGLAGALAITALLAAVITPSFTRLETRVVRNHVERTAAILSAHAVAAEHAARDLAGGAPTAGGEGVARLTLAGRVTDAGWQDRPELRQALGVALGGQDWRRALGGRPSTRLYLKVGPEVAAIGVARADAGLVATARVLTADAITDLLQLRATIVQPRGPLVDIATPDSATAQVHVPIGGVGGEPVAAVRFAVRRDASLLGQRMLLLTVAGSTLLLLLILVVLRRTIARQVLAPLGRVEAHMQRVRGSGAPTLLDEDGRGDEIGSLSRSLNAMLRQLNGLREQVETQAFTLGRSETAVAVMHNVRNALNPVSAILSHGVAQGPPVDRAMLDRALVELARDDIAAERRQRLTAFVTAGVDAWSTGRDAMRAELAVGREAMAHVLEIIGQQQRQAHERPTLEPCDVTAIVARNATIARYADRASIAFAFPSAPHRVLANRVILSQVIGNLFANAAEAIAARDTGSGSVAVTVTEHAGFVEVTIRDDGEGFDAETGAALFQRGFSTRDHKSGGLGLHWCANALTAMDGSLRLHSAGRGLGAVAVLTLRAAQVTALAA